MSPFSSRRLPAESKPLTMRVGANLDRPLQAAALREGVSVSDFVRQAITAHLNRGAAESTLWDRIAPAVVRRGRRGAVKTDRDTGTLGWLAESEAPPRPPAGTYESRGSIRAWSLLLGSRSTRTISGTAARSNPGRRQCPRCCSRRA
jgi:hypothetical protein